MSRVKSTLRVRQAGEGSVPSAPAQHDMQESGRSVFAVREVARAVSVETMLLRTDGQLRRMPAIFPNRAYAMQQIEQLAQLVQQHFDRIERAQPAAATPAPAHDKVAAQG